LLLSSAGGVLYDGFSLYGLLKTIGIEVVTVNMGYVASIANVVFLGGSRRFALPESFFQFHGYEWGFDSAHVMGPHNFAFSTQALDAWKHNTKLLLKAHTKLTDADLQKLKLLEEPGVIDAATAKTHGIVQEVGIPPMPAGTPMINVDY
jgi:ATP-dependent protease ClpP protease subunit